MADYEAVLPTTSDVIQFTSVLSTNLARDLDTDQSHFLITSIWSGSIVVQLTVNMASLVTDLTSLIQNDYSVIFNGATYYVDPTSFQQYFVTTTRPTSATTAASTGPTPKPNESKSGSLTIIIPAVVGGVIVIVLLIAIVAIVIYRTRSKERATLASLSGPASKHGNQPAVFNNPTYDAYFEPEVSSRRGTMTGGSMNLSANPESPYMEPVRAGEGYVDIVMDGDFISTKDLRKSNPVFQHEEDEA